MRTTAHPPRWIKPQLTRLVQEAPAGLGWLHEINYDGYRMHARIESGNAKLLTRTGFDWSLHTQRLRHACACYPMPVRDSKADIQLPTPTRGTYSSTKC